MDSWWSDLFGVPVTLLWRDTVTLGMHAGLGDYPGIFVAGRHGHVHISLPDWVKPPLVHELETRSPSTLVSRSFWESWTTDGAMVVLGPALHAFADVEPDTDEAADVVVLTADDLAPLRRHVSDDEWEESGFGHADGQVHAVVERNEVVAAAHLAPFLAGAGDVNVLVRRDARGRGLGRHVAAAATRTAVRTSGVDRWRARTENAASRAIAAALGFEDYCSQLAVRPQEPAAVTA